MNYMTSDVCKKLQASFFFSRAIHCHPFEWNKAKRLPQLVRSQWRIRHWYFNACLATLNICFVQFRAVQMFLDPANSTALRIHTQLIACWYCACGLMQSTYAWHHQEVERFLGNHMDLMEAIWDSTGVGSEKTARLCRKLSRIYTFFLVSGWTNTMFMSLNGLLRPSSPELVSSIVPNIGEAHWSIRVLFGLLHVYMLLIIVEGWNMLFYFMILVYLTSKDVIILISHGMLKYGGQTYIKFRTLLHYHRCLTLRVKDIENLYETVNGIMCFIALVTVIFCAYEAVNLQGTQAAGLGLIALNWTTMLIMWLGLLADVNKESAAFLQNSGKSTARLVSQIEMVAARKELSSIPELKVKMRNMFYFDKGLVLTALCIITENTVNLILMG